MFIDDEMMDLIYLKAGVDGPLHFWWNEPELVREAWRNSQARKDVLEKYRDITPTGKPLSKARGPDPIW